MLFHHDNASAHIAAVVDLVPCYFFCPQTLKDRSPEKCVQGQTRKSSPPQRSVYTPPKVVLFGGIKKVATPLERAYRVERGLYSK